MNEESVPERVDAMVIGAGRLGRLDRLSSGQGGAVGGAARQGGARLADLPARRRAERPAPFATRQ